MERRQTIDGVPMYLTSLTPLEIIGPSNMQLFVEFLRMALSSTNGGEYPDKRLDREVGLENRKRIAVALEELRASGYYPSHVNDRGEIIWNVVVKSKCQQLMEKGLPELQNKTLSELQDMGRNGYRQIVSDVEVPALDGWETGFEKAV